MAEVDDSGQVYSSLSSSPCVAIHSIGQGLTSGVALATFGDGTLSMYAVRDEAPRVKEIFNLNSNLGAVAHAAAAPNELQPAEFFCALATAREPKIAVCLGRQKDDGEGFDFFEHTYGGKITLDHPVTSIAFDGKIQRVACGSASGLVRVYEQGPGGAWGGALEIPGGSYTSCAREFELVRREGPACHSVAFWPHHNDVVIAAGGSNVYFCNKSSSSLTERVSGDHIFSALSGAKERPAACNPPLTVLCTAFHPEDSWVIFGGTSAGTIVAWDMRRPGGAVEQHSVHSGPVLSLSVAGGHAAGFELLSSGDDGCVKRSRLHSSASSYGARHGDDGDSYLEVLAAPAIVAAAPVTGCAFLTSEKQRREGRGEGFVLASSAAGAVDWAVEWR